MRWEDFAPGDIVKIVAAPGESQGLGPGNGQHFADVWGEITEADEWHLAPWRSEAPGEWTEVPRQGPRERCWRVRMSHESESSRGLKFRVRELRLLVSDRRVPFLPPTKRVG